MDAQKAIARIREHSTYSTNTGVVFDRAENGQATAHLDFAERVKNSNGVMHGGAVFTLVDCAMGVALYSLLDENDRIATVESHINFIRQVGNAGASCTARVIHKGRRTALVEAEVTSDGKLAAKASGTFMVNP